MRFLQLHPELSPFVGQKYKQAPLKVLFLGESHFLPPSYNNQIGQEWYKKSTAEYNFNKEALAYLNTQNIIRQDVIQSDSKNNSHSIYRNIGNIYGEVFGKGDYRQALEWVAFSNYFLRPAEVCGGSIELTNWEEEMISYRHLLELDEELRPDSIIFVSKKARQSFHRVRHSPHSDDRAIRLEKKIHIIPHPTSTWWNQPSAMYDNLSGKEKLRSILETQK